MKKRQPALNSGVKPKYSGQYRLVGPRGGNLGREITAIQDKPLPPTPKPRQKYVLVDKTKHKK